MAYQTPHVNNRLRTNTSTCYCHVFLVSRHLWSHQSLRMRFNEFHKIGQREARRFLHIWGQFTSKCQVAFSKEIVGGSHWYWKKFSFGLRSSTDHACVKRGINESKVLSMSRGGRRSPAVACWASDHWVASSNPLRGKFRH